MTSFLALTRNPLTKFLAMPLALLPFALQDVEIRAVAFNEVGNLLSPLLEEGKCYTIQHFTVKECNPQYPAKHQCELHFNNKTKVVEDPSSPSPEMENLSGSQTGENLIYC